MHAEAAAEHAFRAELPARDELLLHVLTEVRRLALHAREVHGLRLGHRRADVTAEVGARDHPLLQHQAQHDRPPRRRELRVRDRVVAAWILGDAREQRGLRERQLQRAVPEVRAGGPLDAVGPVPEVDRVQVVGEDLVLRPVLLELPGERRLLQLPRHATTAPGELVLDELLRDRRAALHGGLVADIGQECAPHAAKVDAAVLVEPFVLGRDDRLLHQRRDLPARHEDAALVAAQDVENRVPVGGVDVAVDLLVLLAQRVEPLELLPDRKDEAVRECGRREHAQHGEESEEAELPDPAPAPAGSLRLGAFSAQQHGGPGL